MLNKPKEEKSGDLKIYFNLLRTLLYGSTRPQEVIEDISANASNMGVCAKNLYGGEVAWRCLDCELDPTCIICADCFNKGDHKGHRYFLKTNVSGCCDCGDPDGWKEPGFCSDHKGFAASSEAMLKSLPPYIMKGAPHVISSLTKQLKGLLLKLIEAQKESGAEKDKLKL